MKVEIVNVNVTQGDATFVCIRNCCDNIEYLILIDAGRNGSEVLRVWHQYFNPHKIDLFILTHWDRDHYWGLEQCIVEMFVENCPMCCPNEDGVFPVNPFRQVNVSAGNIIYQKDDLTIRVHAIDKAVVSFGSDSNDKLLTTPTNDSSIALLITNGNLRYYTAGDINGVLEGNMVQYISGDILYLHGMKVSHHGSATSTPEVFLWKTKPWISVVTPFDSEHPALETLNLLNYYVHTTLLMTNTVNPICYGFNKCFVVDKEVKHTMANHVYSTEFYVCSNDVNRLNIENPLNFPFGLYRQVKLQYFEMLPFHFKVCNNPIEDKIQTVLPDTTWTISADGKTYTASICKLYPAQDVVLTDCRCMIDETDQITVEGTWGKALLKGNITDKGLFLDLATAKGNLSVKELLLLLTDANAFQGLEYIPEGIFPELKVDEVKLNVLDGDTLTAQALVATSVGDDLHIGNDIILEKPSVFGSFGFIGGKNGYYTKSMYAGISTRIRIKTLDIAVYVSIIAGNHYNLSAETDGLTLSDILTLIPGLDEQGVQSWCQWLGVDIVGLTNAECDVVWENGFNLNSVTFGFSVMLVKPYKFLVKCSYFPSSKHCMLSGGTEEEIKVKELLEAFGVKREHLSFLPDLSIDYCGFSATPSQQAYSLSASVSIEDGTDITIGGLTSSISEINVEIEKSGNNTSIGIELRGKLNGHDISLQATYDKLSGFCFNGNIESINVLDAVKSVIPGDGGLMKNFNLSLENVSFTFSKQETSFAAAVPSIVLGDEVQLNNNSIDLRIVNKKVSFAIQTKLEIQTGGQLITVSGGVSVSPESIYMFAIADMAYRNVLGIKGLDIGKMAVCLAENVTPPGMSIGFMGELALELRRRTLTGDIALYISPQIPSKQLVAVNFNGISLLDIVEIFVQCPNGGVAETLDSVALRPITLAEKLSVANPDSCDEAIRIVDSYEGESGMYEIQTHEKYSWIPASNKLLKNKVNFKTYELAKGNNGQWSLTKYVGMYACVNAKGEGIEMNGITFQPGFAFCAQLAFLGMTAIVDFTATPKRGIKLYAEMQKAIRIGKVLEICRVEDNTKGPILSLSTYPENLYLYLSAKCRILNLFEEKARIAFGNNLFALYLYSNVLGFRTTIEAKGNLDLWNGNGWILSLLYETNGFTEVTQTISNYLHKVADEINKATNEAAKKLENAKRTVQEHERDVQKIQKEIDKLNKQLKKLKKTRYPWYKAYKYIALGIKIAAVGVSIGVLAASKLVAIGVLKAAQGILDLAEKAVKAAGKLTADALRLLGDVTAIVGKSIDWLIMIERLQASLDVSKTNLDFAFSIDYRLCGTEHHNTFSLHSDGNLADALINLITGKNERLMTLLTNRTASVEQLDTIYGIMSEEEKEELSKIDWDKTIEFLNTASEQGEQYTAILEALNKDVSALGNIENGDNDFSFDLDSLKEIQTSLDQSRLAREKTSMHLSVYDQKDFETLQTAAEVMKKEAGVDGKNEIDGMALYSTYQSYRERAIREEARLDAAIDRLNANISACGVTMMENEEMPQEAADVLIQKYESLTKDGSEAFKTIMYASLAEAYDEKADKKQAQKYAKLAIEMSVKSYGDQSEETEIMRSRMSNII